MEEYYQDSDSTRSGKVIIKSFIKLVPRYKKVFNDNKGAGKKLSHKIHLTIRIIYYT